MMMMSLTIVSVKSAAESPADFTTQETLTLAAAATAALPTLHTQPPPPLQPSFAATLDRRPPLEARHGVAEQHRDGHRAHAAGNRRHGACGGKRFRRHVADGALSWGDDGYDLSHVASHASHVTRHTSHVTRHTSHVTRHTSHVTLHAALPVFFEGSGMLLMPTSMTTAPGLIQDAWDQACHASSVTRHTSHHTCTNSGRPMAATTISACLRSTCDV
jgi:hypothetical protein